MKKQKYLKFILFAWALFSLFSVQSVVGAGAAQGGAVGNQNPAPTSPPPEFKNPIGYNSVESVLAGFLGAVQGIVAVLSVLMIVVGGIIYITSAGVQDRVELAKKAVTSAVIGLALALAAPAFLKQIYSIMGTDAPASAPIASKDLDQIIMSTLNMLLSLIGTLAILMLVGGGIMYMTAGGDDARADTAKNTIKYAIIGLTVALISLVLVNQISNLFT